MLLAIYMQGSFGQYAATVGDAITRASAVAAETPAAGLDQLFSERYPVNR
jgi:hypothetical protein